MRFLLLAVVSEAVSLALFRQVHAGSRKPQTIALAHVRLIDRRAPARLLFAQSNVATLVRTAKDETKLKPN
jgi:hypothetical protein